MTNRIGCNKIRHKFLYQDWWRQPNSVGGKVSQAQGKVSETFFTAIVRSPTRTLRCTTMKYMQRTHMELVIVPSVSVSPYKSWLVDFVGCVLNVSSNRLVPTILLRVSPSLLLVFGCGSLPLTSSLVPLMAIGFGTDL